MLSSGGNLSKYSQKNSFMAGTLLPSLTKAVSLSNCAPTLSEASTLASAIEYFTKVAGQSVPPMTMIALCNISLARISMYEALGSSSYLYAGTPLAICQSRPSAGTCLACGWQYHIRITMTYSSIGSKVKGPLHTIMPSTLGVADAFTAIRMGVYGRVNGGIEERGGGCRSRMCTTVKLRSPHAFSPPVIERYSLNIFE